MLFVADMTVGISVKRTRKACDRHPYSIRGLVVLIEKRAAKVGAETPVYGRTGLVPLDFVIASNKLELCSWHSSPRDEGGSVRTSAALAVAVATHVCWEGEQYCKGKSPQSRILFCKLLCSICRKDLFPSPQRSETAQYSTHLSFDERPSDPLASAFCKIAPQDKEKRLNEMHAGNFRRVLLHHQRFFVRSYSY